MTMSTRHWQEALRDTLPIRLIGSVRSRRVPHLSEIWYFHSTFLLHFCFPYEYLSHCRQIVAAMWLDLVGRLVIPFEMPFVAREFLIWIKRRKSLNDLSNFLRKIIADWKPSSTLRLGQTSSIRIDHVAFALRRFDDFIVRLPSHRKWKLSFPFLFCCGSFGHWLLDTK